VINKWTILNCQLLDNGLLLWHVAAILQIFVTRNRLTFLPSNRQETKRRDKRGKKLTMLRWDFEPTPFRTRTLIWRLRPTRPSQRVAHGTYNIDKQEKQNLLRKSLSIITSLLRFTQLLLWLWAWQMTKEHIQMSARGSKKALGWFTKYVQHFHQIKHVLGIQSLSRLLLLDEQAFHQINNMQ
jgi:hypothetical protein